MIKTEICELLDIEYPIFQGGMAWIADADLAAAVSNAGGLGIISAMNSSPEWVRNEIRKAKVDCIRLNFTVESPDECETVVTAYKNALAGIRQPAMPENTFTRGHLKRGVL